MAMIFFVKTHFGTMLGAWMHKTMAMEILCLWGEPRAGEDGVARVSTISTAPNDASRVTVF